MKLIWLDLETTGLDPNKDQMLEIAVSTADHMDPFNVTPVYHAVFAFKHVENDWLSPFIVQMHTKNGLFEECEKSTTQVVEAEDRLLELFEDVKSYSDRHTLAGSAVSFDHSFIKVYMPRFAKRLSHRHYDISSVKLFCESMGMPRIAKAEAHRAKDDIIESIEHGKQCANWLTKTHQAAWRWQG